ncbi:hypothetical protein PhCBS80983_g00668 [Powellomyces hirtus]|uniref:Core domain-containing protein n=1 Tax=Powellomyces hirtus TaxID=109895 RepID=A0A507EE30_9FUNG|nr:hypothetical protein PhCBS80983_g00668 [Powellomyces hirtus]
MYRKWPSSVRIYSRALLTATARVPNGLVKPPSFLVPPQPAARFESTEPRSPETATSIPIQSPNTPQLAVSHSAAKQINAINKRSKSNKMLRVAVDSGGCHGFQYKMELTTDMDDTDDTVFDLDGARVVVDSVSMDFVAGSTLDYVEELIGSSFQIINNPKAESSCGCKTSFNVKF